jgi:transposase-like protein
LFVAGSAARTAASLVGVHRNTAAPFFAKPRRLIAADLERVMAVAFDGPVEIDESCFGGHRRGRRGRGAAGKTAVFGVLKRGGKVYAQMIANCRRDTPPIVKRRMKPDGVVYSDTFASSDTLSVGGCEHVRVNRREELAEAGGRHINGIENSGAKPSGTCGGSTVSRSKLSSIPPGARLAVQRREPAKPIEIVTQTPPPRVISQDSPFCKPHPTARAVGGAGRFGLRFSAHGGAQPRAGGVSGCLASGGRPSVGRAAGESDGTTFCPRRVTAPRRSPRAHLGAGRSAPIPPRITHPGPAIAFYPQVPVAGARRQPRAAEADRRTVRAIHRFRPDRPEG